MRRKIMQFASNARKAALWIGSRRIASLWNASLRIASLLHASLAGAACLAFAAPAGAASVYKVDTGTTTTTTLAYSGEVQEGDLARLQAQTAKVPSSQRIVLLLNSPGGSVAEGIALGRYIYQSKITTVAIQGSGCHSACTFLFLAGRDYRTEQPARIMVKGAKVGFHQTSLGNLPEQNYSARDIAAATEIGQNNIRALDAYFKEIKADPEFLTLTLSASARNLTFLNELDALRLGIFVMDPQSDKLLTPDQFKQKSTERR